MTADVNRLRWRCQRGMLELDHILRSFLDTVYPDAEPEVRSAFEDLLALEDAELLDLIMGRAQPPSAALGAVLSVLAKGS